MILIADSGSTKTTWMEVESGNKVVTEGLNPHFTTDEDFLAACAAVRKDFQLSTFNFQLFFYGAGCGNAMQRERVERLLSAGFCAAEVHVGTDMLGACRAVSGGRPSLVAILGTGSNACYYDGKEIVYQAVSTGYILGDEGSANHVGRQLLRDYLSGCMPEGVSDMFHETYPQTKEEFLEAVYHQPNANRFLASLAQFVVEHQDDDYCSLLIEASLEDWYIYQLEDLWLQSGCDDLYLVGGFAAHIDKTLLDNFAEDHELVIKNVVADPIDGLRRYHGLNETPAAYIP